MAVAGIVELVAVAEVVVQVVTLVAVVSMEA